MSELKDLIKKDRYNFLSPYGLGDTMMLCGFKDAWEKKNKGKIHFIIKPSHEVVMKMYGITDYSIYKFKKEWFKPEFIDIAKKTPVPTMGEIFIAHPHFHSDKLKEFLARTDNVDTDVPFEDFYREFLEIPMDSELILPTKTFDISDSLREKLAEFGDLQDITLLLPEAQSLPPLPKEFWKKLARKAKKQGPVIQYAYDPNQRIHGVPFVDLTIEEIIELSTKCHVVYAYRSGMCDMIGAFVKNLIVFYPNVCTNMRIRFSVARIFHKNIPEQICESGRRCQCILFGKLVLSEIQTFARFRKNAEDISYRDWWCLLWIPLIRIKHNPNSIEFRLLNFIPLLKLNKRA